MPSRSSEFAHPDVLIGLSILAYRYEGLRLQDLKRLVKQLKKDYSRQVGNKSERPACILFEQWKAMGRGRIMQERLRTAKNDAQDARNAAEGESKGESKGDDSKGGESKGGAARTLRNAHTAHEIASCQTYIIPPIPPIPPMPPPMPPPPPPEDSFTGSGI